MDSFSDQSGKRLSPSNQSEAAASVLLEKQIPVYADVILPLSFGDTLTYEIPEEMRADISVGCRVMVPLSKKHLTGIVYRLHSDAPSGYRLKRINNLVDASPILTTVQLAFWDWVSSYYLCTKGDVMKAAIPSGLKEKDAFRPKMIQMLKLSDEMGNNSLGNRAVKQKELLDLFVKTTGQSAISRTLFLEQNATISVSALKSLIDKGYIIQYDEEVSRIESQTTVVESPKALTDAQSLALMSIAEQWQTKDICLLHGVTSSGKTEIYIHLIESVIARGQQVLYLVPEIALSTQLTHRLKRVFGNRMAVYHSDIPSSQRVEIWNNLLNNKGIQIIVGARSSVFLPFNQLGLVIVDEEHEPSYKQQEPAPRYHARNAALYLAKMFAAKSLLGTATPSVESYTKAREGKYGLVELKSRYRDVSLPGIVQVDMKEIRRKKITNSPFSPMLLEKMQEALTAGQQCILFQNRRGYAPLIVCHECSWVPKCRHCDVGLHFHKQSGRLRCHYCGKEYRLPEHCPHCGGELEIKGFGTEKIVEEIGHIFPEAKVVRMDTDSMKSRFAYEELIEGFSQGKYDVLVGTQMLTKGLDFDNVSVVGVLDADAMMNYPDFRSHERAFQMMTQVSGRAGRKYGQACVVVQTMEADSPIVQDVLKGDYYKMYCQEMMERELFSYPPYVYLIDVWFRHKEEKVVFEAANFYADCLRQALEGAVFGPFAPVVGKVRELSIQRLTLKIQPSLSLRKIKDYLCEVQSIMFAQPAYRRVQLYYDVDPV